MYLLIQKYLQLGFDIKNKILPPNHIEMALAYDYYSTVYNGMGKFKKAIEMQLKAIAIAEETFKSQDLIHPTLALFYSNISWTYTKLLNYTKAISFQEKALFVRRKIFKLPHPKLLESIDELAELFMKEKDFKNANLLYKELYEVLKKYPTGNNGDHLKRIEKILSSINE